MHLLQVHLEDLRAPAQVGQLDDDAAVEAAGAQQRRVEHLGAVRRGEQHDALRRVEAVHLDEQLVQRLLLLVVAAELQPGPGARLPDRVELVDEDDARRLRLRLLEEVAHARRADADEHLDELGAADREERHARLARDRAREQRLAGARRADQQHALRDASAEALEALRVAQELDDLLELGLRLLDAGDVVRSGP